MKTKSIWIVEDDPFYTPALCRVLEKAGYAPVLHITTGIEAVIKWRNTPEKPDVIILDMMLRYDLDDSTGQFQPKAGSIATGARVAEELTNIGARPSQILVITALHKLEYHEPVKNLGIPILLKPARVTEILAAVRKASESR